MSLLPSPLPPHPRLFAHAEDWERISKLIQTDDTAKNIWQCIYHYAQRISPQPPLTRTLIGRRMLQQSRYALLRISTLAMVARITGEQLFAERAILEMEACVDFEDWNPSHFLDVAEMATAVAIGYDWLYDSMTAEQREKIRSGLLKHAILPACEDPDLRKFFSWYNNWNQVCNAGVVTAALAIAEDAPKYAEYLIAQAIEGLPNVAKTYAPAGVYPEGPMYWSYGTTFHVLLTDALKTATGSTHETEKYPGFKDSVDYINHVTAPSGEFFNFGDCRALRSFLVPFFWFASHFDKPEILSHELQYLSEVLQGELEEKTEFQRLIPLALIWWSRHPVYPPQSNQLPPYWYGPGEVPIVVYRAPPTQTRPDLYFALKGGSPSVSHAHMDIGSFIFEAEGIRWAVDTGMQEYHTLEQHNINLWQRSQEGSGWKIFRLGPDSHNIARFDSPEQNVHGHATFIQVPDKNDTSATLDLSSLYPDDVQKLTRQASLLADNSLLLTDKWQTGPKPANYRFQWMTRADRIDTHNSHLITLYEGGKSLSLSLSTQDCSPTVTVEDVSQPREYYDAPNPGLKRITIHLPTTPPNTQNSLEIRIQAGA